MTVEITTWLPIFPGFYGTSFEGEAEDDANSRALERGGYPVSDVMDTVSHMDSLFQMDWEYYRLETARRCTDTVFGELRWILPSIKGARMLDIDSPREYNFTNDSIMVTFDVDADALTKEVQKLLKEHDRLWRKYLEKRYKSRSGFKSFYPYTPEEWSEATKGYTDWSEYQHAGAVFDCLLWVNDYDCAKLQDGTEKVLLETVFKLGDFSELPEDVQRFLGRRALDLDDLARQREALRLWNPNVDPKMDQALHDTCKEYVDAIEEWFDKGRYSKDVEDYVANCAILGVRE